MSQVTYFAGPPAGTTRAAPGGVRRGERAARRGAAVVLIGARGVIGRVHAAIWQDLGVRVAEADLPEVSAGRVLGLGADAIADVCTPTSVHTESMLWAYRHLGVRRFLVEKPAAGSPVQWRRCLAQMPGALVFTGHCCLFSDTFRAAADLCPQPARVLAVWDKDRRADDLSLRGAAPAGDLPDVWEVEAPHALSVAAALQPGLRVTAARYTRVGVRAQGKAAPVACEARLSAGSASVLVSSDLRAPRCRRLELRGPDGGGVSAVFPPAGSGPTAVFRRSPSGTVTIIRQGPDDLLKATLTAALDALTRGEVPPLASPGFAADVLVLMEQARAAAARGRAGEAGDGGAVHGR
jgi:predicted dehydrogenase